MFREMLQDAHVEIFANTHALNDANTCKDTGVYSVLDVYLTVG